MNRVGRRRAVIHEERDVARGRRRHDLQHLARAVVFAHEDVRDLEILDWRVVRADDVHVDVTLAQFALGRSLIGEQPAAARDDDERDAGGEPAAKKHGVKPLSRSIQGRLSRGVTPARRRGSAEAEALCERIHKVVYDARLASSAPRRAELRMSSRKSRGFLGRSMEALQDNVQQAGPAAMASYTLVGGILLLGGLGYAIDVWRGSAPWGLLIGSAPGCGGGVLFLDQDCVATQR